METNKSINITNRSNRANWAIRTNITKLNLRNSQLIHMCVFNECDYESICLDITKILQKYDISSDNASVYAIINAPGIVTNGIEPPTTMTLYVYYLYDNNNQLDSQTVVKIYNDINNYLRVNNVKIINYEYIISHL